MPDRRNDDLRVTHHSVTHHSVTHHSVTIDGQLIEHSATAGTLILTKEVESPEAADAREQPKARLFFVAYTRTDLPEDQRARRLITCSFNGGPGIRHRGFSDRF